jgi:integrase
MQAWHEYMTVQNAPTAGDENPLSLVLDLYLQHLRDSKASAKTLKDYKDFFQWFIDRWPKLTVRELRSFHMQTWFREHPKWGPSYRNKIGTAFKAALNWATGADGGNIIPKNPLDGMSLPQSRSRGAEVLISDEDHKRLLAVVPEDLKRVLIALRHTGTRPSNIWRAEARNLDRVGHTLVYADWNTDPDTPAHKTAKKTGRALVITLTPVVFDMCCRLADQHPSGPLFRTKKGEPWTACKLANRLRWYTKRLGIEHVICYGYRHSVATELLEKGVPDAEVAAILGHTGTDMIYRHYGHLGARITRIRDTLTRHRPAFPEEIDSP